MDVMVAFQLARGPGAVEQQQACHGEGGAISNDIRKDRKSDVGPSPEGTDRSPEQQILAVNTLLKEVPRNTP